MQPLLPNLPPRECPFTMVPYLILLFSSILQTCRSNPDSGFYRNPSENNPFSLDRYHIPDQYVYYGTLFQFQFPLSAFESRNIKSIDVHLVPKIPLPTWLKFDQDARELQGMPSYEDIGEVQIRVITKYSDVEVLGSHIFRIKVLNTDPVNLAFRLDSNNVSSDGFDQSCIGQYPQLLTYFFNMNYNFLELQAKIKFFLIVQNGLQVSEKDIKIGTARNFYRKPECEKQSSQQLQATDEDRLALRIVSKRCRDICGYAEELFGNIQKLQFGDPEVVHWITYDYGRRELQEERSLPRDKPPVQTPWYKGVTNYVTINQNDQALKPKVNWDFMLGDNILVYVGQILAIPISPYLIQNEKVYRLTPAENINPNDRNRSPITQWVQLMNNSTDQGGSLITVIGIKSMVGSHPFCLRPSLIQDECLKFSVVVQERPKKLTVNHAISMRFDFPEMSFERSMEVKLNLMKCLLSSAYPDEDKPRYDKIQLNDYGSVGGSALKVNISLNSYYASLCAVKDEVDMLYSQFALKEDPRKLSLRFLATCQDFDPKEAMIEYFGACSGAVVSNLGTGTSKDSQSSDTININISTILLVAILSFIVLVVIGISIVFLMMHLSARKPESIYCADSFCEMRAKNMPTIFAHEIPENNSSRSSSPSRLYSLVPQSSTKSTLVQPNTVHTRVICSSRPADSYQSRNSFGSNRSEPVIQTPIQTSVFDHISEMIRTTPTSSFAPSPVSPTQRTVNVSPDILLNSHPSPLYDVPNCDSVMRFGSFHKPKVETICNTMTLPHSNYAGYSPLAHPASRKKPAEQNGKQMHPGSALPAYKKLMGDNSDEKEFLQFRIPSPLPTQALLLQAQANRDQPKVIPSNGFC